MFVTCDHWLSNEEINTLAVTDMSVASHFCRSKITGGGTAILFNNSLRYETICLNVEPIEQTFEYCASSLKINNSKFIIISLYRSPNSNIAHFFENLELLLSSAYKYFTKIILAGDFNTKSVHRK